MDDSKSITDVQELTIRRMCGEVVRRIVKGTIPYDSTHTKLTALIEDREEGKPLPKLGQKEQPKKRDRAEERRQWFRDWYRELGFELKIPKPSASNREFDRRRKAHQALFYRPPTSEVGYDSFMSVAGQGNNWTVTSDNRHKIWWEDAGEGYWFWAEVQDRCSRTGTSWNKLNREVRLLSLEEYVIVWCAHRNDTGILLDIVTWTWLRTRYRFDEVTLGALCANVYGGQIGVNGGDPDDLSFPYGGGGGRAAEAIGNRKRPRFGRFRYGSIPIFFLVFFRHPPSIFPISCSRFCR